MMASRPPKQSMSELKLRRLTEHNQRLREDLDRSRVRVSEASASLIRYCKSTRDYLVPSVWGTVPKDQDPYAPGAGQASSGAGCCTVMASEGLSGPWRPIVAVVAANFYLSSHGNNWLVDRKTLTDARRDDLKYATAEELAFVQIWTANVMHKLAKKLMLRQQVTATAIVYLRRFYLKNAYCETDPALVIGACIYVAGKAEEIPVHIKSVVSEARSMFSDYGITSFPSDNTKLAEMEFCALYLHDSATSLSSTDLLEDLEFHLVIFHPYRSLIELTGRNNRETSRRDAMIQIDDNALQNAWYIINDTYRSDLCLVYPPYVIAAAAVYFALALDPPVRDRAEEEGEVPANLAGAASSGGKTDPIAFLASLNISMPLVMEVLQELISLYAIWRKYETHPGQASANASAADKATVACLLRMREKRDVDLAHPGPSSEA